MGPWLVKSELRGNTGETHHWECSPQEQNTEATGSYSEGKGPGLLADHGGHVLT